MLQNGISRRYTGKLERVMSYQDLDRIRRVLNHDKIMNAFLNKIGSIRSDLDLMERSEFILKIWREIRGGCTEEEDLKHVKVSVQQGLNNWPNVLSELRNFFETVPQKCGYRGTERFEQARRDFFEGDNSKTAVITQFVNQFYEIPKTKSEEKWGKCLKEFWEAANAIHKTLSEMRPGMEDDALFGEYFEKI